MRRNINAEARIRARNWTWTYFPDENETLEGFMNEMNLRNYLGNGENLYHYLIAGEEIAPTTNKRHFQCYIECYKQTNLTTMKNKLNNEKSHWEIARGNKLSNKNYCTKDGNYKEYDEIKINTDRLRERTKPQMLKFLKDIKEMNLNEIEEAYPVSLFNMRNKILDWRANNFKEDTNYKGDLKKKNYWIWGKTGVGKSKWVREQGLTVFPKTCNKWWNGYDNQKIVLIDDFPMGDQGKILMYYMKIWSDRYQFMGELKNAHIRISPKNYYLIITANHSIEETFNGCGIEDINAIKRRFTEINIKDENDLFLTKRISDMQ